MEHPEGPSLKIKQDFAGSLSDTCAFLNSSASSDFPTLLETRLPTLYLVCENDSAMCKEVVICGVYCHEEMNTEEEESKPGYQNPMQCL